MRNRVKWAMLLMVAVISTNVWAAWDPDTDPCLVFNLDFEDNTGNTSTTDSVAGLVGTVSTNFEYGDMWLDDGKIGISGDFTILNDLGGDDEYQCRILVEPAQIFDCGEPEHKFTYTFWFNTVSLNDGTIIRREYDLESYPNNWWEIYIDGSRLHFFHKKHFLRMGTTETLSELGLLENTWHFAAVVVDRTVKENSRIYLDGLKVPVTYADYQDWGDASVDLYLNVADLQIGAGEHGFDGYLDEIRLYHRDLNDVEVSVINQTNPEVNEPIALVPIPRSINAGINTSLTWIPNPYATSQEVYFGREPNTMTLVATGDETLDSVSYELLNDGNKLDLSTTYYWEVNSPADTNNEAPIWSFTTETGKPFNPSPTDGERDVPVGTIRLLWTGSASAVSFDVYFSEDASLVEANNVSVQVADDTSFSYVDVSGPVKGETYYWRVICNFEVNSVPGDVWSFRTEPELIIVNTSDAPIEYDSVTYDPCTLTWDSNTYAGIAADDNTVIFSFPAGDVNFSEYYDIVVIPLFDNELEADMNALGYRKTSSPMAIHVDGNLYFNCKLDVSGLEAPITEGGPSSQARCGGHRGSFENENFPPLPESYKLEVFGPGYGGTSLIDEMCGSGGGYGGAGGDNGRAGPGSGGSVYGYQQIPIPLGGSAGGWSSNAAGGPGGGAVEVAATGNVTFGPDAELLVNGGGAPSLTVYGAGGGSGGSVRIIASGVFVNDGTIAADGGAGGNTTQTGEPDNPGGGGGGGRVSVYATNYTNNGQITVNGGPRGERPDEDPDTPNRSLPGEDGTVFVSDDNPAKAIIPTPADESTCELAIGQTTVELKWYPGFGATGANANRVYFGTDPDANLLPLETTISGNLRAQQSHTVTVTSGNTYYWYVKTTTASGTVDSDVWSFNAVEYYDLVFNTDDTYTATYNGQTINPLTCMLHDSGGWSTVPTTTSTAVDGLAIFNFSSDFNYPQHNIVVVPEYGYERDPNLTRRALGIHVDGDVCFDGTLDISGDGAATGDDQPKARSGGHRGARAGGSAGGCPEFIAGYYTTFTLTSPITHRLGTDTGGSKTGYPPSASGYDVFGPGTSLVPPLECSGGGGYGGIGGDSGRGYFYGIFAGGCAYGDKEVPIPFGGSAGGWGRSIPSGAGGGGIEVIATGNVTFGSHAKVLAEGGGVTAASKKPGGGGAGGSVKVIAGGSFTNNGIISVNGGEGGNTTEKVHQGGGGGSGGRVSIFYGGSCAKGQISANGGAKGTYVGSPPSEGYANDGQDGTIFVSNGSPKKASAPTPRDGDEMVYVGTGSITLKWYSGYGAGTDRVYFGTDPYPTTQLGSAVTATRGQHSSTVAASISAGNTYYWKVVTDGTVESDVWSFSTVGWQCSDPLTDSIVWDSGYYYDCLVNLVDLNELGRCWFIGDVDMDALAGFVQEWLNETRD